MNPGEPVWKNKKEPECDYLQIKTQTAQITTHLHHDISKLNSIREITADLISIAVNRVVLQF
jgi:hypothetical protein